MEHLNSNVAFIAVNYNSARSVALLLEDLLAQDTSGCTLTIVIVDNSPSESELSTVRETYGGVSGIRFERMSQNLGYFGAAYAAFNSIFKARLPDWTIVSNADIRLQQPGFFKLIAALPPEMGIVAPRIISGQTGLDQNPFLRRRPSRSRMLLNRIIPRVGLLAWLLEVQCVVKRRIRSKFALKRIDSERIARKIYAPHGAFIVFGSRYFQAGGSLNVGAFLFAEEKYVGETCRRIGIEVTYAPWLEVKHEEHISTRHNPNIRSFEAAAADYCYCEFFSESAR
jgi:glycosyltransferase involved in cell wall biosynthesis